MALKASNETKRAMTHCKKGGHEFTPENTIVNERGGRKCRTCHGVATRKWLAKKRAENKARTGYTMGRSQSKKINEPI